MNAKPRITQREIRHEKKVLILDDDSVIIKLINRILEGENYHCSSALDTTEARHLLRTQSFDLILSDINMPGESGLEFIRFSLAQYPNTAVANRQTATEALSIGVYGYLIKPFHSIQLLIAMDNAFRRLKIEKETTLNNWIFACWNKPQNIFRKTRKKAVDGSDPIHSDRGFRRGKDHPLEHCSGKDPWHRQQ